MTNNRKSKNKRKRYIPHKQRQKDSEVKEENSKFLDENPKDSSIEKEFKQIARDLVKNTKIESLPVMPESSHQEPNRDVKIDTKLKTNAMEIRKTLEEAKSYLQYVGKEDHLGSRKLTTLDNCTDEARDIPEVTSIHKDPLFVNNTNVTTCVEVEEASESSQLPCERPHEDSVVKDGIGEVAEYIRVPKLLLEQDTALTQAKIVAPEFDRFYISDEEGKMKEEVLIKSEESCKSFDEINNNVGDGCTQIFECIPPVFEKSVIESPERKPFIEDEVECFFQLELTDTISAEEFEESVLPNEFLYIDCQGNEDIEMQKSKPLNISGPGHDYFLPLQLPSDPIRSSIFDADTDSTDPAPSLPEEEMSPDSLVRVKHPLANSWTFWYFTPDKNKIWEHCQNEVLSVQTIEDFWGVFNWIKSPSELRDRSQYSFFMEGVRPDWADPMNSPGGRLVLCCERYPVDFMWLEVLLSLVGGMWADLGNHITGAVVGGRNRSFKLELWLSTKNLETVRCIEEELWGILMPIFNRLGGPQKNGYLQKSMVFKEHENSKYYN